MVSASSSPSNGAVSTGSRPAEDPPSKQLVLVASENPSFWHSVRMAIEERFAVAFAVDLAGTVKVLREYRPALLILCSRLLDADLEESLRRIRQHDATLPVVVITKERCGTGEHPPDACLDERHIPDTLLSLVSALLQRRCAGQRGKTVAPPPSELDLSLEGLPAFRRIVGSCAPFKRMMDLALRVAPSDATVLITGESGTGKELLARWIHCLSHRASGPFRVVDLTTIPDHLFESILFGHERGAFTGAVSQVQGKFLRAHQGTLLLDEISSLGLPLQPKILRVIQEKEVETIGGRDPVPCDVRVIAATNMSLADMVRRGTFRADLYYRLNVINIRIPPLRERLQDLPELVTFFVKKHAEKLGVDELAPHPEFIAALQQHHWPGNIRELENRMQRALLLARSGKLEARDLFEGDDHGEPEVAVDGASDAADAGQSLEEIERRHILQVLKRTEGNQSQAAQILQIDRKTLRAKLQRYLDQPMSQESLSFLRSVS
jgi:DNA-binding NtrC family response regulator